MEKQGTQSQMSMLKAVASVMIATLPNAMKTEANFDHCTESSKASKKISFCNADLGILWL